MNIMEEFLVQEYGLRVVEFAVSVMRQGPSSSIIPDMQTVRGFTVKFSICSLALTNETTAAGPASHPQVQGILLGVIEAFKEP
jgi:hypothetical protein